MPLNPPGVLRNEHRSRSLDREEFALGPRGGRAARRAPCLYIVVPRGHGAGVLRRMAAGSSSLRSRWTKHRARSPSSARAEAVLQPTEAGKPRTHSPLASRMPAGEACPRATVYTGIEPSGSLGRRKLRASRSRPKWVDLPLCTPLRSDDAGRDRRLASASPSSATLGAMMLDFIDLGRDRPSAHLPRCLSPARGMGRRGRARRLAQPAERGDACPSS